MTEVIYLYISLVIAILSLLITTIISIYQIHKTSREAMRLNRISIFAEYTKRYQDIILNMPPDLISIDEKEETETTKYLRLYFDLCSEEYHLYTENLVPEEIWGNWCDGMKGRMKRPIFLSGWQDLQCEYNTGFVEFMNTRIITPQTE